MGVDVPRGTNSGAAEKSFEVKSRMQWPSAPGILWLITVPSAGTTLWIFVSSVRPTRHQLLRKSARLLGESVTTPFISTASLGGSKPGRCAPWTTESGSSKSMGIRKDSPVKLTHLLLV